MAERKRKAKTIIDFFSQPPKVTKSNESSKVSKETSEAPSECCVTETVDVCANVSENAPVSHVSSNLTPNETESCDSSRESDRSKQHNDDKEPSCSTSLGITASEKVPSTCKKRTSGHFMKDG